MQGCITESGIVPAGGDEYVPDVPAGRCQPGALTDLKSGRKGDFRRQPSPRWQNFWSFGGLSIRGRRRGSGEKEEGQENLDLLKEYFHRATGVCPPRKELKEWRVCGHLPEKSGMLRRKKQVRGFDKTKNTHVFPLGSPVVFGGLISFKRGHHTLRQNSASALWCLPENFRQTSGQQNG